MTSFKCLAVAILLIFDGMILGINGTQLEKRQGTPIARDVSVNVCVASSGAAQCSQDCKSLLICAGTIVLASAECPPSLPYCQSGRCVKDLPSVCGNALNMWCPGTDNYFPDPTNCLRYYYCNSNRQVEQFYECPVGFPFNVTAGTCVRGTLCGVINCRNQIYAVNPYYPRLGALCNNNYVLNYTYTYCPPSYEVGLSLSCEPKCRQQGDFALIDDKNSYMRCLPSGPGNSLVLTVMKCPGGQEFDQNVSKCKIPSSGGGSSGGGSSGGGSSGSGSSGSGSSGSGSSGGGSSGSGSSGSGSSGGGSA